jgi:hypothetical protein
VKHPMRSFTVLYTREAQAQLMAEM